jgi:hypothetical protein
MSQCIRPRSGSSAHRSKAASLALLVTLLCSAIAPGPAESTQYRVCPTCSIFKTIDRALDSTLTTGDTIIVSAGTYRENRVIGTDDKDALSSSPTVLLADGEVIIDGADPFGDSTWTLHSGSVYKATRLKTLMTLPLDTLSQAAACYVHVDTSASSSPQPHIRYKFVDGATGTLNPGEWSYDTTTSLVYVNLIGGGTPAGRKIYIGDNRRVQGLRIRRSDNFVIDGFTIKHMSGAGILIQGTTADTNINVGRDPGIVVKNCYVFDCFKQGIQLNKTTGAVITNNTTASNGDHGIQVILSDGASITRNTSYLNDHPLQLRGGKAGIRIGNGGPTTLVYDVNVDYNVLHDNEDTGIDILGAHRIAVRRNASYKNRDHGFDNNITDSTMFINNTAFGNEHDGLSIESTSAHVGIYNCIFAYNAHTAATLQSPSEGVYELEVNGTSGFTSDYNDFAGWGPGTTAPSGERHLFKYNGVPKDVLGDYQSVSGQDANSYNSFPAFADTTTAPFNFTIRESGGSDNVIDAASTVITGWTTPMWLSVDPHGIPAHNAAKFDHGAGGGGLPAYADIGAFEYDPRPGPTTSLTAECVVETDGQWHLTWPTVAEDSTTGFTHVDQYQVRYSTSAINTDEDWNSATSIDGPDPYYANPQWWIMVPANGPTKYVRLKTKDAIGQWSALSNQLTISSSESCGGHWYGGGGGGGGCCHEEGLRGPSLTHLGRPGDGPDSLGAGENTILHSAATGTRGVDLLSIEGVQNDAGSYLAHLRVTGGYGTLVDGVRMLFVDHPIGTEALECGSTVISGSRTQASQATTDAGDDVTSSLNGTGGIFNADGSTAVTITTPLDALETPVVIECANGGLRGNEIIVESQGSSGWERVGTVHPRRFLSAAVIDSVPAGPVRLRFTGYAQVTSVARLVRETANVTSTWGELEGAVSSSAGDVLSAVGVEDTVATALVGPDTLVATFSGPALAENVLRSVFLGVAATPVTASAASSHAAAQRSSSLPSRFALYQNVPNPFRGSTTFRLDLPVGRMVRLEIFDVSGRRVRTLVNHFMPAGRQSVAWNQRDDAGAELGAGVYFARVQADTFRDRKKLILMP